MTLNRLGRLLWFGLNDMEGSDRALKKSLTLCEGLVAEHADAPEYQNELAEAQLLTGKLKCLTHDLNRARGYFESALLTREKLTVDHPDILDYQANLVDSCVLIAAAYSNAREASQVTALYSRIRQISDRLARDHPDVAQFGENHCLIEMLYLIHLARSGEHAQATTNLETILKAAHQSGMTFQYAACCYCVAGVAARLDVGLSPSDRARQSEEYQKHAMVLLRRARETGFFRQPYQILGLKSSDPDLAPLRNREDFKKFVAELEAEPASPAP